MNVLKEKIPDDLINIINEYIMISRIDVEDKFVDVLSELSLYFMLKNLDLNRSEIKNRIVVLNYIQNFLIEDIYLVLMYS